MIRQWALLCLAIVWSPVEAAVEVKSGEHDGYTRLVLEFDSPPNWSMKREPGQVTVLFTPFDNEISIDRIFSSIPRKRLRDLVIDTINGGLVLKLNCLCQVEGWTALSRYLVVDIKDQDPGSIFDNDVSAMTEGPIFLLSGHTDLEEQEATTPSFPSSIVTRPRYDAPVLPFPNSKTPSADSITHSLSEELARAAAQGLVQAGSTPPVLQEDRNNGEPASQQNVRVHSGLDVSVATRETTAKKCPNSRDFALTRWFEGTVPSAKIAQLRRALTGEFDDIDPDAAFALARYYVALGFGWEARSILAQFLPNDPRAANVSTLSFIVENGVPTGDLSKFGDCKGDLPLWALLDAEEPLRAEVDIDAALIAFAALPNHLRHLLGPRLTEVFQGREEPFASEVVRASIARISTETDPVMILTDAVSQSNPEVSNNLDSLATSSRSEASIALEIALDQRLAGGMKIPNSLIDAAESISFELFGSEQGEKLKALELRARIANLELKEAFQKLIDNDYGLNEKVRRQIWREGFDSLIRNESDVDFLEHIFSKNVLDGLEFSETGQRRDLALRLLSLGFPSQATRVVANIEDIELEVHLSKGDLESAAALASSNDKTLGEILVRLGKHKAARDIFIGLGDIEAIAREEWRAGLWSEVQFSGDESRARAAQHMLDLSESASTPSTISSYKELLEASANLKNTMSNLLRPSAE